MIDVDSWRGRRRRARLARAVGEIREESALLASISDQAIEARLRAVRDAGRDEFRRVALALAVEGARRALGVDPRPPQIAAALLMQDRAAIELDTGEGKTLALALAAVPLAITHGVHLVTANDYLAERDARAMGPLFGLLGLSVGHDDGSRTLENRRAHRRDVLYTDPRSLAFHVLRDGLRMQPLNRIVGDQAAALIDELDSVLVDAAMTPFAIAAPGPSEEALVVVAREVLEALREGRDYVRGAGERVVELTEEGEGRALALLAAKGAPLGATLYEHGSERSLHRLSRALVAHAALTRDLDYLVTDDGRVTLLDARTGRRHESSRLRDGLHAAVEAKERVPIVGDGAPLASLSVRSLFSRYPHLAGASGTLVQAERELEQSFGLTTTRVRPHRPPPRVDEPTRLYASARHKVAAIAKEVERVHASGRPVLVGTQSIEEVDALRRVLEQDGMRPEALSARNLHEEARVIAKAGEAGAVTIATQIAGRGTDITLGHDEASARAIEALGGLCVIGATRNAERRVDRQLRGRAGRRGSAGSTVFFASADEPLIRRLATTREHRIIEAAAKAGGPVTDAVERTLARVQRRAERSRASQRALAARLDAIHDEQLRVYFGLRESSFQPRVEGRAADPGLAERIAQPLRAQLDHVIAQRTPSADLDRLRRRARLELTRRFGVTFELELLSGPTADWYQAAHPWLAASLTALRDAIIDDIRRVTSTLREDPQAARAAFSRLLGPRWDPNQAPLEARLSAALSTRLRRWGPALVTRHHRRHLLRALDEGWRALSSDLASLRDGLPLMAYGFRDPFVEYRRRSFEAFERMREGARLEALSRMLGEETNLKRVRALENDDH